jgi:hypothetical protein
MPDKEKEEQPVYVHNDEQVSEEEQHQIDKFEQEDFDKR